MTPQTRFPPQTLGVRERASLSPWDGAGAVIVCHYVSAGEKVCISGDRRRGGESLQLAATGYSSSPD